ncbi:MAG: copper oxidase [Candidatus Latescibacteria bacterium]|nr:copper oxidase [Candidatus Latescibacterota bacterium]
MNQERRGFLKQTALAVTGLLAGRKALAAQETARVQTTAGESVYTQFSAPMGRALPVDVPDLPRLPWRWNDGAKEFHLVADVVKREFLPGSTFDVWGYNGSMPGPTIEVNQGDRVRVVVENRLPEPTTVHWHGVEVPIAMDGVEGVTQDPIPPGGRFVYEFTVHQYGTFFYHAHMPMQQMMGMIGLFIMHPREPYQPRCEKDFGLILQEWAILPNNTIPNSLSMEFNWLTINGKSGPATTPLIVKLGERVRIRMVNLSMDHHPMHLHGNTFYVTGTEAGRVPQAAWTPANTVIVGVAQCRDVEFEAKYPGDWMLHCHLPHHMMNHMASMVGPLVHLGQGMHPGMGMEEGMGVLQQGTALSEENGPSLGRSMGVGATFDEATTHLPLQQDHSGHQGPAARVPGYPQDHFMAMDALVDKSETYGLRPAWSGGVMGMTTLVRVLPPALYDKIMVLKKEPSKSRPATQPEMEHRHE